MCMKFHEKADKLVFLSVPFAFLIIPSILYYVSVMNDLDSLNGLGFGAANIGNVDVQIKMLLFSESYKNKE